MGPAGVPSRVRDWFRDPIVRTMLVLVAALLAATGSIVSFVFFGDSRPTQFEVGLLVVSVFLAFYVSLAAAGT